MVWFWRRTRSRLSRAYFVLSSVPTDSIDEIRAVDILEHLSYRDTIPTLTEWARVLKPGGRMFIQVPAADLMMETWYRAVDDERRGLPDGAFYVGAAREDLCSKVPDELDDTPLMVKLAWRLLGGHFDGQYTRDEGQWYLNAHHALFDQETIRWAAEEAGLRVESIDVNPHPNYLVWLVKPLLKP